MTERIIIDLAVCDRCEECTAGPAALALREKANFELVCRRCEQASCVMACPFAALERTEEGIIKRHNMRCVSCKSCALACPFGTIYMELLPFYAMDYESAVGHLVGGGHARDSFDLQKPVAGVAPSHKVTSPLPHCPYNALLYDEPTPTDHIIDNHLAARTRRWNRKEKAA